MGIFRVTSWKIGSFYLCSVLTRFSGKTTVNGLRYMYIFCLFVCCFTSKATAMVIAARSVHLTTFFPGQAWTSGLPVIFAHTFACNWQQPFLNESAEGRKMTVEIISWSISTKVWDRTGIELATPWSAVRHTSVARHVTDCATRPGIIHILCSQKRRSLILAKLFNYARCLC